jgi:hypothetical protein
VYHLEINEFLILFGLYFLGFVGKLLEFVQTVATALGGAVGLLGLCENGTGK